jgi:hypothetical protein
LDSAEDVQDLDHAVRQLLLSADFRDLLESVSFQLEERNVSTASAEHAAIEALLTWLEVVDAVLAEQAGKEERRHRNARTAGRQSRSKAQATATDLVRRFVAKKIERPDLSNRAVAIVVLSRTPAYKRATYAKKAQMIDALVRHERRLRAADTKERT